MFRVVAVGHRVVVVQRVLTSRWRSPLRAAVYLEYILPRTLAIMESREESGLRDAERLSSLSRQAHDTMSSSDKSCAVELCVDALMHLQ